MKEVILSALLLFIGGVAAQENPLGDIIPALPSGIDPQDLDLATLTGFLDGMTEGGGDGDSSNLFDADGIIDFLSDLFDGGDDSGADDKDVDGGQPDGDDAANGGVEAPNTIDILGAVLSNNDINVECSASCTDMDLCKLDLSMLTDDTDNLEQMCDAGCIPNILVKACAQTDGISDGAAITGGAVAGGVGGAAGAATAMNVCDFVTCCVNEEDVVTSSTRSRFEGCKASLPDLDNLTGALAGAAEGIGEDGDILTDLNDLLDESNSNSETPEEDDPEEDDPEDEEGNTSTEDLYNPPELEDPDELGLGFSTYDTTSSGMTFSTAPLLTATAIISTVLVLVI